MTTRNTSSSVGMVMARRLRPAASLLLPAALLLAPACVQAEQLRGTVASFPVACATSEPRPGPSNPLAGAKVDLVCPDSATPIASATTDTQGRFWMASPDRDLEACELAIKAEGYAPRRYALADLGLRRNAASLAARLLPAEGSAR